MVFAPRFEIVGGGVGGWLLPDRRRGTGRHRHGAWTAVRDYGRAVLHRGRRERGARAARGRRRDQHPGSAWVRVLDAWLLAGGHPDEEAPARLRLPVRRGVGRDHLEHRGHRRCEPEGGRRFGAHRGVRQRAASTPAFGRTTNTARSAGPRSGGARATRSAPRPTISRTMSARSRSRTRPRRSTTSTSARSSTRTAARSQSRWTAWRPPSRPSTCTSWSTAAPRRT